MWIVAIYNRIDAHPHTYVGPFMSEELADLWAKRRSDICTPGDWNTFFVEHPDSIKPA